MKGMRIAAVGLLALPAMLLAGGSVASVQTVPAPTGTPPLLTETPPVAADEYVDLGNTEDEALHELDGWDELVAPPDNPYVSPTGDRTKRYQAADELNSVTLFVAGVGSAHTLIAEVEDGWCNDNFKLYVNDQGPVYSYSGHHLQNQAVVHVAGLEASLITSERVKVTFENTRDDGCGRAAVYNVRIMPGWPLGLDQGNPFWNIYDGLIHKYAAQYDLPPELLKAVMLQEGWGFQERSIGQKSFPPARSYLYEPYVDLTLHRKDRLYRWPELLLPDNPPPPYPYPYDVSIPDAPTPTTAADMCEAFKAFSHCGVDSEGHRIEGDRYSFVAQYRIAASYGLGQIVYSCHYDKLLLAGKAPEALYDPELNVHLAALILHQAKCPEPGGRDLNEYNTTFSDWVSTVTGYNAGNSYGCPVPVQWRYDDCTTGVPDGMTNYAACVRRNFDKIIATTPTASSRVSKATSLLMEPEQLLSRQAATPSEVTVDALAADLKGAGQLQLATLTKVAENDVNFTGVLRIYTDSTGQVLEWQSTPLGSTTGIGGLTLIPNVATGSSTLQAVWGTGIRGTVSQFVHWDGSAFHELSPVAEDGSPLPGAFFSDRGAAMVMPDGAIWVPRRPLDAGPLSSGGEILTLEWNGASYELTGLCPDDTDTDHDGLADLCDIDDDEDMALDEEDLCPTNPDCDEDGFKDGLEDYLGTDPLDACPDVTGTPGLCPGPSCDGDDAWPFDNNIDTWSNVLDVLQYKGHLQICVPDPNYVQRLDINADDCVDVLDVLLYKGHLQVQCANP
jgi:hypothetical protein